MSGPTSDIYQAYPPVYDAIPQKWEESRDFLVEALKLITNALNVREIGFFLEEQLVSGQQFIPATAGGELRDVFRKVINFGALPNTATKSVPHGITVDDNFTLVHLYASATKPTVAYSAIPIPYASPTTADEIAINIDSTNINITTGSDRTAYTRCYVVIEYLLQV